MSLEQMSLQELCVNTIRTLSIDAVHTADSGHPGAPLGCSAIAYTLWANIMKFNPDEPNWPDRDRFVLSAGHASALLYSMLHLCEYELPLQELKDFRQFGSMTPGHPEARCAPGVEVTTGPLGQGLGDAVGMALAERYLAARFNRPGHRIVDHHTYVLASDGDMMEGISHEAASLAGHLGLGKLIVLYDSNDISLEGPTSEWFTDDTAARFEACGWHTTRVEEATTDVEGVTRAVREAQEVDDRPSLIVCHTHIGYASPVQDTHAAHGKPLDADQLKETKRNLGWPEEEMFLIPDRARERFHEIARQGRERYRSWRNAWQTFCDQFPTVAGEWERAWAGQLPEAWEDGLPIWEPSDGPIATRDAAGATLGAIRRNCWTLVGGDADLGSSTRTLPDEEGSMQAGSYGRQNIRFGVREHVMGAACAGMALHGGLRAFGSTFTVFSDYVRPALRMAAISEAGVIYQFTHDSVGIGEDGPTHQPVEHVASLRAVPNCMVIRPADANEAREAWRAAMLNTTGVSCIICSRQKLPVLDRSDLAPADGLRKGAYVLHDPEDAEPRLLLLASGSEVWRVLEAARQLEERGIPVRVVSFPCWELFERQSPEYRRSVLPPEVGKRLALEAGSPLGWHKYVGTEGEVLGLRRFGASGPGEEVMRELGFSVANVVDRSLALLDRD